MKKKISIAILLFAFNSNAQIPTNGLIGWFPFNGNTIDESNSTNDGVNNGAILASDRFGNPNSAFNFNGTSSYISVPNIAQVGNAARTISAWIKTNSAIQNCVISTGDYNLNSISFNFVVGYSYGSSPQAGTVGVMGFNNDYYPSTGTLVNDSQWHLICATYDGAGSLKIYVDGQLNNTANYTYNTNGQFNYIGKSNDINNAGANQYFFDGLIDDVGFWNRELIASEVNQLFNSGICYETITVTDTLIINSNLTGFNPVSFANTIKIFPNPTNDQITIDFGSNFSSISGYSLKINNSIGQEVFSTTASQQFQTVDLSTWSGNGVYFVNLIDETGNTIDIRKIVLQ